MGMRRSAGKAMRTIERGVKGVFTSLGELHLARRAHRLVRSLGDEAAAMRPEPWELVRSICAQAKKEAVFWSNDEFGYPNLFTVKVAREAWGSFYGNGTRSIEQRVAEEVGRRLADGSTGRLSPVVRISCDEILPAGEYQISSAFRGDRGDEGGVRTSSLRSRPSEGRSTPWGGPGTLETVLDNASDTVLDTQGRDRAYLLFDGVSYEVSDGMTVGAPHHRERAGLALPIGRNDRVSGIHGKIVESEGVWEFEQIGINGSVVVTDGAAAKLVPGERAPLTEGAKILLPHVEDLVTFALDLPKTAVR